MPPEKPKAPLPAPSAPFWPQDSLELTILRELCGYLVNSDELPEMVNGVFGVMVRRFDMVRAAMVMRRHGILSMSGLTDLPDAGEAYNGPYRLGGMLSSPAAKQVTLEVISEPEIERRFPDPAAHYAPLPDGTVRITVPIRKRNRRIGMLEFDQRQGAAYGPERTMVLMELLSGIMSDLAEMRSRRTRDRRRLMQENQRLRSLLDPGPGNMVGASREMRDVYAQIRQVAPSDATVLIRGGSGTGKELVARAIVELSPRKGRPFVAVNCAALPETLIESELFGHERGAFTGAMERRIGRAEAADGGTLFLDEIGDLTPATQVKLLRFLQERTFSRIGSNEELHADVRILAATSRDLEDLMARKLFREDLYYRLNIFSIALPDLAARRGDIIPLARHFVERFNAKYGRHVRDLSPEAATALLDYRWPGNVRELENAMERAVITASGAEIHLRDLPPTLRPALSGAAGETDTAKAAPDGSLNELLDAYEKSLLQTAMARHGKNLSAAARELGISPRVMYYKVRRLGLG